MSSPRENAERGALSDAGVAGLIGLSTVEIKYLGRKMRKARSYGLFVMSLGYFKQPN
jgi:hypothetical protein